MPKHILSIDTGTPRQVLAYQRVSDDFSEVEISEDASSTPEKNNHSATLLRNISVILGRHAVHPRDLDLVSVAIGPGSFTGLRIGLAIAKSLARAADAAIVGVPTLDLFAETLVRLLPTSFLGGTSLSENFYIAIDARRREVFSSHYLFSRDSPQGWERCTPPTAQAPRRLLHTIATEIAAEHGKETCHEAVVVAGDCRDAYPDFASLPDAGEGVVYLNIVPDAVALADLGRYLLLSRGGDCLQTLEPNYVRPSDAKKPSRDSIVVTIEKG